MNKGWLLAIAIGAAQTSPTFDVAAIKQNKSGENNGRFGGPPTRFTATNAPAMQLILFSYNVQAFQVEGGPDWLKTERWDINAKSDKDFPPVNLGSPDPRRDMLRALLVDRMKLKAHTEKKDRPIYQLVTVRPDKSLGPQLKPSAVDCIAVGEAARRGGGAAAIPRTADGNFDCGLSAPPGRIAVGSQPMSQIAMMLSSTLQRAIIDRTGITGNYTGTVTYTPETILRDGGPDLPAADPNGASLFTALQEQFGLKLEPSRGQVDILVIDHIERPSED